MMVSLMILRGKDNRCFVLTLQELKNVFNTYNCLFEYAAFKTLHMDQKGQKNTHACHLSDIFIFGEYEFAHWGIMCLHSTI